MTIQEMHYLLKMKVNKVDNNKEYNLLVPEIDAKLNEALTKYITNLVIPLNGSASEELNKRIREDLKPLIEEKILQLVGNNDEYLVYALPKDYFSYIDSSIIISNCKDKKVKNFVENLSDNDLFNVTSYTFEQGIINFIDNKIYLKKPKEGEIKELRLLYVKKHPYIHFAQGYRGGKYKLGEILLTGKQDCILPEHTHYEIVDLATKLILTDFITNPKTK